MKIAVNCLYEKPKWVIWLIYLVFALGLLIAVPFAFVAIVTEISLFIAKWWINKLKDWLNIDFEI